MTTSPAVREFEVALRGEVRDLIMDYFRSGLRMCTNPETGNLFTEDEIVRATAPGSRWYREAQAIDDAMQGEQRRALFINDQLRINRACTRWLEEYHARQWDPDGRLAATRGSGSVEISGTAGTPIVWSTDVPDETAYWGTSASGVRVQVFASDVIGPLGNVTATMIAMEPGAASNLAIGDIITWANRDPGMAPQATVTTQWGGGTDIETDAEWASRMEANQRHRPGSGNDAQQRAWARRSSNAIEDAFIYPCAFGDGSFMVCILQKRGAGITTPLARIPSSTVKADAVAYLTPPGSPVEPTPPRVMVVEPWQVLADFGIRLSLLSGSDGGWTDARPWPNIIGPTSTSLPRLTSLSAPTANMTAPYDTYFPGYSTTATLTGADCPRLMFWYAAESEWRELTGVDSIANTSANTYAITFSAVPAGLTSTSVISPLTELRDSIAQACRDYMDERGPGELYADTDYRFARCSRFPEPREEKPFRIGAEIATRAMDGVAGAAGDADLPYQLETPGTPVDAVSPQMYFLGKVGVYPLV